MPSVPSPSRGSARRSSVDGEAGFSNEDQSALIQYLALFEARRE
jgi:hypothetical protein